MVVFTNVTVVSAAGSGTAPESDHRPWIRYTNGSTLLAAGTTFQALGSRSSATHRGVTVGSNSVVTATDTTFRDSGRGLDVYRASRVTLTRVTASGNGGPGIVVNQARNTTLADVTTVQRINTHGGAAQGACDQAGAFRSVPYSADYVFLSKRK